MKGFQKKYDPPVGRMLNVLSWFFIQISLFPNQDIHISEILVKNILENGLIIKSRTSRNRKNSACYQKLLSQHNDDPIKVFSANLSGRKETFAMNFSNCWDVCFIKKWFVSYLDEMQSSQRKVCFWRAQNYLSSSKKAVNSENFCSCNFASRVSSATPKIQQYKTDRWNLPRHPEVFGFELSNRSLSRSLFI